MQVTFIQPYYINIWESLGVAYIVAYCKKHYKGKISFNFFQSNFDDDELVIEEAAKSDIVAFSCTSPTFAHGVRLAEAIKAKAPKDIRTVFGGWHVTSVGAIALQEDAVDQIVMGEGELAFLEILNGKKDDIVFGKKLGWDELEWPDREIVKNDRTLDLCAEMTGGLRIGSFQANRVCPFNCAFCAEKNMTGRFNNRTNPVRTRSVSDICDEIEKVTADYNLNFFKFVDATFDTSAGFVIEFCKEKMKRPAIADIPWEMLCHASLTTEEMFKWLKKAECSQVNIGVESGSKSILRDIGKGLSPKIIRRVFEWGKKHGVERRGFFILGMPNETAEDHKITEELIDEIQPDVVGFTILCPYPGSDFYDPIKHKYTDWAKTDEYSNDFWETDRFSNKELKEVQTYFSEKYKYLIAVRQHETDDARE